MKFLALLIALSTVPLLAQDCETEGPTNAEKINGKPLEYYLNHPGIDKTSKAFFLGEHKLYDDSVTFAMMDSLTTDNQDTRPFFLYNMFSITLVADGAISEVLGEYLIRYAIKFPKEFACLFEQERYKGSEKHFLMDMGYSMYPEARYTDFLEEQLQNCESCEAGTVNRLKQFHKDMADYMEY